MAIMQVQPLIHLLTLTLTSLSEPLPLLALLWCATIALLAYHHTRPLPVYLLGYSCFKPSSDRKLPYEVCEYFGLQSNRYTPESAEFMRTIYKKSGLGPETYAPPSIFDPSASPLISARLEVEEGILSAASSLLSKSDIRPSQITHLIVAASAFSPSPSLSSLLVRRLRLRDTVNTLTLAGMGCSGGTTLLDLAARLLRRTPGYALVAAVDATGISWYHGNHRPMLVTNCIFCAGAAAALLGSGGAAGAATQMELVHTLRTHHGEDDAAYGAAMQEEDKEGLVGIRLRKELVKVAGESLRKHVTALAPHVLPVREIVRYLWAAAARGTKSVVAPDFTTAFEHMCIHAGGKAVIDGVERMMRLPEAVTEPARMCLHRFGNTSGSMVFYEMAYMEAKGRVRAGDRVWMLGFGSGFKVCSVVWRALKDSGMESDNPWGDCIHRFPVDVPKLGEGV